MKPLPAAKPSGDTKPSDDARPRGDAKPLYELHDVGVRIGEAEILRSVSLPFHAGELTAIVGPNGAGKTTLMSVLSGVRTAYQGTCLLAGVEISRWKKRDLARRMAFIPQVLRLEFSFTAEQVVLMGRTPHCNGLFESPEDFEIVRRAMRTTATEDFAQREFRTLSGGERQRVILAGALAQEPSILLLDEPTTFLDLKHQVSTYRLLRSLARDGVCVIAVTHDLNLAASYSDRIVVLSRGQTAADGSPEQVLRAPLIRKVFEVDVEIHQSPSGRPWVGYQEQSAGHAPGGTTIGRRPAP